MTIGLSTVLNAELHIILQYEMYGNTKDIYSDFKIFDGKKYLRYLIIDSDLLILLDIYFI